MELENPIKTKKNLLDTKSNKKTGVTELLNKLHKK
jgi:hypothetical protein